ncbi:hypothetical protein D6856_02975 [Butyrivibrio sp. XB500-5]|uniref:hypothetical protein n=1 Tax=Butyrivibrio sp. XB500-5 TaxID=2364880 RepID=UPI000EA9FDF0|nr:hypothetical protein [Butyrivibrio sp. XB500-5]RKM63100.1 hypothetical protein D6856_02975 [Butyrivibrio sp. XB500-5]
MEKRVDPFTRTPGIAGAAYIDTKIADEIIDNFTSDESSKYVYKITGLRGAGKSVEYGKVIRTLKDNKKWLVYPLSAAGDVVKTLISKMSMESFIDSKSRTTEVSSSVSASGDIYVASGKGEVNIGKKIAENEHYYSDEATLVKMVSEANKKKYNVLVGVDDISKTPEMVKLLSMIGSMILEGMRIYLVVTGLAENIEEFSSEKNLTFFKRADELEIKGLNKFDITAMYQKLLKIDALEAKKIEEETKGYAYAYQVLGSLYYGKQKNETISDLIPEFERILFRDSYDLVWKSLSKGEKEVIRCICRTKDGKAEDIKNLMKNKASYPVYRSRLLNKHLVNDEERGYMKIRLPHFDRFVEIWGEE